MSASEAQSLRADWLDPKFWDLFDRIESRHRRIQSEHDSVRRSLERVRQADAVELARAWQRYCQVIAELESATAEIEFMRSRAL